MKRKISHKQEERLEEEVSPGIHKKIKKLAKKKKSPVFKKDKNLFQKAKKIKKSNEMKEDKIEKTMHEFKEGDLHSGSKKGPKVTNPKQAIAIALSQARKVRKKKK